MASVHGPKQRNGGHTVGAFSVAYTGTQDAASQDGAAQDVVATPTGRGASVLTAGSQPRDKVLTTPISEG